MPKDLQTTNYHGAVISDAMANSLKNTPIGKELLRFEKRGDQNVMQVRLPEKGLYSATGNNDPSHAGKEYDIRKNMNYLTRGIVRACMDENGNIDPNKVSEMDNLCNDINSGLIRLDERKKLLDKFIKKLDIPKDREENFRLFLGANNVPPVGNKSSKLFGYGTNPANVMLQELDGGLLQYQKAMSGELGEKEKRFASKFSQQYDNMLQSYRELANMDPEKEMRILYPMDCISFQQITRGFIDQNNAYRAQNGMGTYDVESVDLIFNDREPKANEKKLFKNHSYLTAKVPVVTENENGLLEEKEVTLSLESTAPAGGELLFRPSPERTGVGVFESKQAAEEYHRNRNIKEIPEFDTFHKVKNHQVGTPVRGVSVYTDVVKLPPEKSYSRYFQLHTGKYAVGLSDKKLVEYTAKAAAATFMKRGKQSDFSLGTVRSVAESMQNDPRFRAIIKANGIDKVREVMTKGAPTEIALMMGGGPKRYAVDADAKQKLRSLGESMDMRNASKEWKDLNKALTDGNMKNSDDVFTAVEKFTKGRKSVKNDPQRKASVDLALKALAVVAESGDDVAKARAQILVDRFNQVRGKPEGHPDHVDLKNYAAPKPAENAPVHEQEIQPLPNRN